MARRVFVDSNIIIDSVSADPVWGAWSVARLDEAFTAGPPVINAVVYAEVSASYERTEEVDALLSPYEFVCEDIPREAAFLAGKAFREYRRRSSARKSMLPDFLIGAHAVVRGLPLLTRDRAGYGTYFPELEIIAPDAGPTPAS
ncbi:MAG: type II toxin-antitoxin system VapC family toxin [Rhodospirillales bacterium]